MPLVAVGATAEMLRNVTGGLPAGAVEIETAKVVMAATPCDAGVFRDVIVRHAQQHCRDVLLARTGLWPEVLTPVSADVALTLDGDVLMIVDLVFFRHTDGSLWLVPSRSGPFIAITPAGLGLEMIPPFGTWSERSDGVCRAAAELVRITRSGRAR